MPSHAFVQQYASLAQTVLTQGSHEAVSDAPAVQAGCAQQLNEQWVATSLTQVPSHALAQQ